MKATLEEVNDDDDNDDDTSKYLTFPMKDDDPDQIDIPETLRIFHEKEDERDIMRSGVEG